ncbi:DUF551 domain-containing protein [Pantoea agglomerans]
MSTFTKEQLIEKLQHRISVASGFPESEKAQMDLELARIALASLEAEPVAWLLSGGGAKNNVSFDSGNAYADPLREVTPLYTAPPAPVDNIHPLLEFAREYIESWDLGMAGDSSLLASAKQAIADSSAQQLAPVSVPDAIHSQGEKSASDDYYALGWNACRAAMLKHSEPFIVTSDHRMMEMPQVEAINAVTAILQGADGTLTNEGTIPVTQFKPVADLYGLTSPTGGETSFTFDAVEARDFIDGGWSCQEYVELGRFQEAMLQGAENAESPTTMKTAPALDSSPKIAESPSGNYPVIPDGWVACSERMPETMVSVLVTGTWFHHAVAFWDGLSWCDLDFEPPVTHWMPLPAEPQQEVK